MLNFISQKKEEVVPRLYKIGRLNYHSSPKCFDENWGCLWFFFLLLLLCTNLSCNVIMYIPGLEPFKLTEPQIEKVWKANFARYNVLGKPITHFKANNPFSECVANFMTDFGHGEDRSVIKTEWIFKTPTLKGFSFCLVFSNHVYK